MKELTNIANLTIKEKVLLTLMGMLVFSTLTARVSVALRLPLTLPEPFFFLFLVLLKKHFLPVKLDKNLFFILFIALFFLVLLSQVTSDYPIYAVLSSSRGYLYLFLFLCVFKCKNKLTSDDVLYLSFGSLIGWTIASLMAFRTLLANPNDPIQTNGNMIAVVLFISTAFLNKKWGIYIIGFALLMIIGVASGIRRVILVIIVANILTFIIYCVKYRLSIFKVSLMLFLVSLPFIISIPYIDRYLEENVPVVHYRLFTKTEESLKGESSESDENRKNFIRTFNNNIESYLLPQGMVSNQYLEDDEAGIFMDFPFLAISHVFSFPIALCFVLFFSIQTYKSYLLFRNTLNPLPGIYIVAVLVMFVLLFVEGTFLVHPFTTPLTGLCLGKVIYYGRKYELLIRKNRKQKLYLQRRY